MRCDIKTRSKAQAVKHTHMNNLSETSVFHSSRPALRIYHAAIVWVQARVSGASHSRSYASCLTECQFSTITVTTRSHTFRLFCTVTDARRLMSIFNRFLSNLLVISTLTLAQFTFQFHAVEFQTESFTRIAAIAAIGMTIFEPNRKLFSLAFLASVVCLFAFYRRSFVLC